MSSNSGKDKECLASPSSGTRKEAKIPGDFSNTHQNLKKVTYPNSLKTSLSKGTASTGEQQLTIFLLSTLGFSKEHHVTKNVRKPRHILCHGHLINLATSWEIYKGMCLCPAEFSMEPLKVTKNKQASNAIKKKKAHVSLIQRRDKH